MYDRQRYAANIERMREKNKRFFEEHPEYWREKGCRMKLIMMLGSKCVICGYDKDRRALQVDHIFGKGRQETAKYGTRFKMYGYYLRHEDIARQKLQVLCANCNFIKKQQNEEHRWKVINPPTVEK